MTPYPHFSSNFTVTACVISHPLPHIMYMYMYMCMYVLTHAFQYVAYILYNITIL